MCTELGTGAHTYLSQCANKIHNSTVEARGRIWDRCYGKEARHNNSKQ